MGIFSRLSDIINANITSLLDRAEDPEKMVRLMIQEMEDTLVEVRSAAVRAIADRKELERRVGDLAQGQAEWERKAEFALARGREDLAKGALVARRKLAERETALRGELELVASSLERHGEDVRKLEAKLDEAKARKKALEIRMKSAKGRERVNRTLHDRRVDDALGRYETLERRIDELEAGADSYELGRKAEARPTLAEELAELEAEADVAEELARLKARVSAHTP
jgi:phage shock protein A